MHATETHYTQVSAATTPQLRYLSFRLGGLEYGLDFGKVQELRPLKSLDRVSSEGEIVSGVAVSRGVIMPIVDMRVAFRGDSAPPDPMTNVIILKLSTCVMGMVVDGVTDVVTLTSADIAPIPGAADKPEIDYLLGMGQAGDGRRLILVDIDKLMSVRKTHLGSQQAA